MIDWILQTVIPSCVVGLAAGYWAYRSGFKSGYEEGLIEGLDAVIAEDGDAL